MAGIKMVHCRHEQAGGYAADAYARASGKIGVCVGTAGSGMTNQISAIATAPPIFARARLLPSTASTIPVKMAAMVSRKPMPTKC